MATRGIRNNNPGNIEHGQPWVGLAEHQLDERFCTFVDPCYGIRAIHMILQAYQKDHHLRSIRDMITRWAPPNENPTEKYIVLVTEHVNSAVYGEEDGNPGIISDDPIDIMTPTIAYGFLEGIITEENGPNPYDKDTICQGMKLAGVVLP